MLLSTFYSRLITKNKIQLFPDFFKNQNVTIMLLLKSVTNKIHQKSDIKTKIKIISIEKTIPAN